jgi:hypothetical protein
MDKLKKSEKTNKQNKNKYTANLHINTKQNKKLS